MKIDSLERKVRGLGQTTRKVEKDILFILEKIVSQNERVMELQDLVGSQIALSAKHQEVVIGLKERVARLEANLNLSKHKGNNNGR